MNDPELGIPVSADRANELRAQIRDLIRTARRAKSLSQAALGSALGSNRFLIIRVEKGERDITVDEAAQLDRILGLDQLVALTRRLENASGSSVNRRDAAVAGLLRDTPDLESVTIVIADDLDVFDTIYDAGRDAARLDAREITIIFPSAKRERVLNQGEPSLWGFHEYQIKRLADLQGGDAGPAANLQMYESDRVTCSAVLASTQTGNQSIIWPALPTGDGIRGAGLPVVPTNSADVSRRLKAHIDYLIEGREPLRTNEALCRFDNGSPDPRFTRYFAVGADEEDDVAGYEGFAVSLVLATALCPRKQYGIGTRVILYKRPSSRHDHGLLSLFSNNVDDADIRAARAVEQGAQPDRVRSTRSALTAALDINSYLAPQNSVIPDLAFQLAAARELTTFGLDVRPDRLKPVALPPELRLIPKTGPAGQRRAAVAPHLFVLELDPSGAEPELDTLSDSADSEVIGVDDIVEFAANGRLNSFLVSALEGGFLTGLMQKMGVAKR